MEPEVEAPADTEALTSQGGPVRRPSRRADAQSNRERILNAAREALVDPGAEVSMEEVARRAGVGMGTLYRTFPSRRGLLEGLYGAGVDELCGAAAAATGPPGETLVAWLRRFAVFHRTKHPIAELLRHTDATDPVFGGSRDRVLAAGRRLSRAGFDGGSHRT